MFFIDCGSCVSTKSLGGIVLVEAGSPKTVGGMVLGQPRGDPWAPERPGGELRAILEGPPASSQRDRVGLGFSGEPSVGRGAQEIDGGFPRGPRMPHLLVNPAFTTCR